MSKSYIISSHDSNFIAAELDKLLVRLNLTKNSPDYLEIKTEKKQSIGIDQMRELKNWLHTKPYNSENKLAVIISAELLTEEAQNSMLKQLEEPAPHSFIVLLCTNHKSLLPTVLSRCELIVDLRNLTEIQSGKFLALTLVEQLKLIEEILTEKDKTLIQQQIKSLLTGILLELEIELKTNPKPSTMANIVLVEKTANMINGNASKRIALENMVLNMV